mmetsp:Transcript_38910/g.85531  ORF Transcript_38910/g.85531 Transcript_38910/m.85531 type:complete len:221 (+) Transcript_38910:907-1569(+)
MMPYMKKPAAVTSAPCMSMRAPSSFRIVASASTNPLYLPGRVCSRVFTMSIGVTSTCVIEQPRPPARANSRYVSSASSFSLAIGDCESVPNVPSAARGSGSDQLRSRSSHRGASCSGSSACGEAERRRTTSSASEARRASSALRPCVSAMRISLHPLVASPLSPWPLSTTALASASALSCRPMHSEMRWVGCSSGGSSEKSTASWNSPPGSCAYFESRTR